MLGLKIPGPIMLQLFLETLLEPITMLNSSGQDLNQYTSWFGSDVVNLFKLVFRPSYDCDRRIDSNKGGAPF